MVESGHYLDLNFCKADLNDCPLIFWQKNSGRSIGVDIIFIYLNERSILIRRTELNLIKCARELMKTINFIE